MPTNLTTVLAPRGGFARLLIVTENVIDRRRNDEPRRISPCPDRRKVSLPTMDLGALLTPKVVL